MSWEREYRLYNAVWVARLSDGSVVYQDDGSPGKVPYSAWLRLRERCLRDNVEVEDLWLQFRTRVERPVPAGAAAYFFRCGVLGGLHDKHVHRFFLIGHIDAEGVLRVQRWKVPELYHVESETRDPNDQKLVGDSLIRSRAAAT